MTLAECCTSLVFVVVSCVLCDAGIDLSSIPALAAEHLTNQITNMLHLLFELSSLCNADVTSLRNAGTTFQQTLMSLGKPSFNELTQL